MHANEYAIITGAAITDDVACLETENIIIVQNNPSPAVA